MCGISGFQGEFSVQLLTAMSDAISCRGPDASGEYYDAGTQTGLAHRRLSIIDLSDLGSQPMWDVTGTAVITFNGEIYNYRELREDLTKRGRRFKSATDTEVLLNGYLEYGVNILERLNGIFAFGIYDTRDGSLVVARDGFGVKPLYYASLSHGFLFASELKCLLWEPTVPRDISYEAVRHYLAYLWAPAPLTMLKSVRKLEPGRCLTVRNGAILSERRFYELPYDQPIAPISVDEAVEELTSTMRTAVQRQMVSDAPLGAFLSGGLDSSAVASFARESLGKERLQCFTIAASTSKAEGFEDDLPYARSVARHLELDLHVIETDPSVLDDLFGLIYHLDEPQADPAGVMVNYVSRLARSHGIKVLLSGAGADDVFGGYRRHRALQLERYWGGMPLQVRRVLRNLTTALPNHNPLFRRLRKAFENADLPPQKRLVGYFHWLHPATLEMVYGEAMRTENGSDFLFSRVEKSLEVLSGSVVPLNRMLFLDAKHFLTDHNLNYTDKMSMEAGVETRVPFLDPDIVAFAARLPLNYKQHGSSGKWILKKAMELRLPREVIHRPKTGFGGSMRSWFKNGIPAQLKDVLSEGSIRGRGLFDPSGTERLIKANHQGKLDAAYTIFAMACVEIWLRTFVDPKVPTVLPSDS